MKHLRLAAAPLAAVMLTMVMAPNAFATTHLSGGTISSNTTWTTAGIAYVFEKTETVATGVTLTVDPGVIVKFNGTFRQLIVNGTLYAVGTSGSRIYFTSLQDDSVGGDTGGDGATSGSPGQWLDMELSNSTSNDIEYTTIRYGGYGTSISWGALQIFSGSALLSHDEIDHNSKTGLIVAGSTTSPPYPSVSVDHTSVHDNGYGMYISDGTLALSGNSAVDDNASFGIKFNIPNTTGDEPATSSVYHSEIAGNGDWGIYLGVGNLVTDYPHGQYNNIYSNAGYVNSNEGSIGDLEIAYVNLGDNWEYNYFGGSVDASCPFGPYGDRIVGSVHLSGPVSSNEYLGPPPPPGDPQEWCYGNNVDTLNTSGSLIDNSGS